MSLARTLSQVPPVWMNLIFCLIGVVCVFAGALFPTTYSTPVNLFLGVGSSFIASAVMAYLTSHYLLAQSEAATLVDDWRLRGIYRTRADANQVTNQLLSVARRLDIIAFGLRGMRDNQAKEIELRVKGGLEIRILAPNPSSTFVTARTKAENHKEGQMKKEINDLIAWCKQLKLLAPNKEQIQIRVYDAPSLDYYFRCDHMLFVGPYQHGKTSQQTITYSFASGGYGFDYWQNYFNSLWNDGGFCQDALAGDQS